MFSIVNIVKTAALMGAAVFVCATETGADIPSSSRSSAAIQRQMPTLKSALSDKGLDYGAPIFLRIIKSGDGADGDGYLEAFVEDAVGHFSLFKRWDICNWSGALGPKLRQGDGQSPEGFYFVTPSRLNPYSSYHLSFNLGYPNTYDRAHGRTGDFLMVHGKCVSIGCYAMTDQGIEEIYTLMNAALEGGQPFVRVHIFPFAMTDENMTRFQSNHNAAFWKNLKTGWDHFERDRFPPNVETRDKVYIFNSD